MALIAARSHRRGRSMSARPTRLARLGLDLRHPAHRGTCRAGEFPSAHPHGQDPRGKRHRASGTSTATSEVGMTNSIPERGTVATMAGQRRTRSNDRGQASPVRRGVLLPLFGPRLSLKVIPITPPRPTRPLSDLRSVGASVLVPVPGSTVDNWAAADNRHFRLVPGSLPPAQTLATRLGRRVPFRAVAGRGGEPTAVRLEPTTHRHSARLCPTITGTTTPGRAFLGTAGVGPPQFHGGTRQLRHLEGAGLASGDRRGPEHRRAGHVPGRRDGARSRSADSPAPPAVLAGITVAVSGVLIVLLRRAMALPTDLSSARAGCTRSHDLEDVRRLVRAHPWESVLALMALAEFRWWELSVSLRPAALRVGHALVSPDLGGFLGDDRTHRHRPVRIVLRHTVQLRDGRRVVGTRLRTPPPA